MNNIIDQLIVQFGQAPVLLGPFQFQASEVPSHIRLGGAQRVAIHRLVGGGRIIDAMGPDESSIEWSGLFTGSIASARARSIDAIRKSGSVQRFTFSDYVFNTVITKFDYVIRDRGAVIEYRLKLEVLADLIVDTGSSALDLLNLVAADVSSAVASLPQTISPGLGALQTAIMALSRVLAATSNNATISSSSSLVPLGSTLEAAGQAADTAIAISSLGVQASSSPNDAGDLANLYQACSDLASGLQVAGYVDRAGTWFGQIGNQSPTASTEAS